MSTARQQNYFCHSCEFEIVPLRVPDPVCPRCRSDFVEEISRVDDPREQYRQPHPPTDGNIRWYTQGGNGAAFDTSASLASDDGQAQQSRHGGAQAADPFGAMLENVLAGFFQPGTRQDGGAPETGQQGQQPNIPLDANAQIHATGTEPASIPGFGNWQTFSIGGNGSGDGGISIRVTARAMPGAFPAASSSSATNNNGQTADASQPNAAPHGVEFASLIAQALSGAFGMAPVVVPATDAGGNTQADGNGVPDPFIRLMHTIGLVAGNPGDYVHDQRTLDEIITRLMEQHAQGAQQSVSDAAVDALPLRSIPPPEAFKDGMPSECAICKEDFYDDVTWTLQDSSTWPKARQLPCKHAFHDECIRPWLKINSTCPVCRSKVEENPAAKRQDGDNLPGSFPDQEPVD